MDILVPPFIKKKYKEALQVFDLLLGNTREIIRHGRGNPRKKNYTQWITNDYDKTL